MRVTQKGMQLKYPVALGCAPDQMSGQNRACGSSWSVLLSGDQICEHMKGSQKLTASNAQLSAGAPMTMQAKCPEEQP